MKFTFIFKESLQRPRFVDIEADSFDLVTTKDVPAEFLADRIFLYGLVDYENSRTIPVAVSSEGKVVEVPDGDFGELTPVEYFEEQS